MTAELDTIFHQIDQYLYQDFPVIRKNGHLARLDHQIEPLARQTLGHDRLDVLQHVAQVPLLELDLDEVVALNDALDRLHELDDRQAQVVEMRAKVVEAEAEVPRAMADAFRSGNMGIMDYYRMRNIEADTDMRKTIGGSEEEYEEGKGAYGARFVDLLIPGAGPYLDIELKSK